ncbi:hypothetical protein RHMOL_Rhmol12G0198000 [Rhododendron molle]|uniref:Uncharacterized protein n=1 Tax=Rhododendron molle TaxID=49168 RepID=A0ACC0LL17_RHOML|nr:hypothetical protein RHMOL_Rhmol12G0198000 [Rhododendron molle]
MGGRQVVTKSVLSHEEEAPVSAIPFVSERALESEGEGIEYVNVDLVSLPAAASKDKPVVELSRSKSNVSKGKKKRKEFLQKVDALGTTSDLYMAYKGLEEKNETVASLESTTSASSVALKQEFVDTTKDDLKEIGAQNLVERYEFETYTTIISSKRHINIIVLWICSPNFISIIGFQVVILSN